MNAFDFAEKCNEAIRNGKTLTVDGVAITRVAVSLGTGGLYLYYGRQMVRCDRDGLEWKELESQITTIE